jgi:hypothetical protein
MRKSTILVAGAAAVLVGGALALGSGSAVAASVSERICGDMDGIWDKSTKTCITVVETKPGNNQGNATWEEETTDTAHGNLKNAQSTSDSSCEGPGSSTSKC